MDVLFYFWQLMSKLPRIFLIVISIGIGVTFLYSAYTKLFPIQSFEYTMVEFVHMPWLMAAIGARLLIGLEAGLGALMVLHMFGGRKWVLKLSLLILIMFSFYLVYLWATQGNNVNCGCFGDMIWMSPSSSLIKNGFLIAGLLLIIKYHDGFNKKWAKIVSPILLVVVTILPFILFALPDQQPTWLQKDKFQINLSALYNPETAKPVPAINLNKGKYVISFLSLSCPHCRTAAHKMQIMKEKNPELPFFFVIAGKDKYQESFWKETRARSIPHTKLDADAFTAIAGYAWPVIYFVNDGWVEAQSNYISLGQDEIEKWLAK